MKAHLPAGEPFGQVPDRLVRDLGARAAALWAHLRGREARGEPAAVPLADLARHLGCTDRHVRRTAAALAAAGWLVRQRTGRQSRYETRTPPPEAVLSTADDRTPMSYRLRTIGPGCPIRSDIQVRSRRPPPKNPPCGVTVRRGGERTPPPAGGSSGTTTATTGLLPEIAAFLARQVPPEPADEVLAEISRDLALGRYTAADLAEYVEALPRIAARAWRVRDELPVVLATRRALDHRRRLGSMQVWIGRRGWLAADPSATGRLLAVDVERERVTVRWDARRTVEFRDPIARVFRAAQPVPARTETGDAGEFLATWRLEDEALPLWAQTDSGPGEQGAAEAKGA